MPYSVILLLVIMDFVCTTIPYTCIILIKKNPFNSDEWPRQNFSLRYRYNVKETSDENKEKYQLGDYKLIQYQILQTNITRSVWQTVGRMTNETLGVKGLSILPENTYTDPL